MPDLLPAPWINGPHIDKDQDWHSFRADAHRCHYERRCLICGEPNGNRIVLGAMTGARETSGSGGHPRCIWIAVNTCPHLVELDGEDDIVAWDYVGPGLGYEADDEHVRLEYGTGEAVVPEAMPLTRSDLKALAKADPLGLTEGDPRLPSRR